MPVIVMEKMQFSLRGLVEKHNDTHNVSFINTAIILNDVCCGLHYLHSRTPPIVHRDLTPNNILLCQHLRAKITDLGVARTLQATDTTKLTKAPGTLPFMPPECLTDNPVYGLSLDIFSFGGVILYITTRQWPTPSSWISFDNAGEKSTLSEVQRRQQYLDKIPTVYAKFKPLVISCLDDNPNNRPTVEGILTELKEVRQTGSRDYFEIRAGDTDQESSTQAQQQEQLAQSQGLEQQQQITEKQNYQKEQEQGQQLQEEEKHHGIQQHQQINQQQVIIQQIHSACKYYNIILAHAD